jgi:two-component system alkaline phosphatase synthesis response regulator PhoP
VKKKIVIVDDFEESCQLMVEILSSEFDCKYICQPEKALELIHSTKPDLILMDYKMPYVTGVELCKIIKDIPTLKKVPIIFISGAVTSDERIETLESGGDDFLSKPFHPKELLLRAQKRLKKYNVEDVNFLTVSNIKMNLNSRQCHIESREVLLTPKQFEILKRLKEKTKNLIILEDYMKDNIISFFQTSLMCAVTNLSFFNREYCFRSPDSWKKIFKKA